MTLVFEWLYYAGGLTIDMTDKQYGKIEQNKILIWKYFEKEVYNKPFILPLNHVHRKSVFFQLKYVSIIQIWLF